MLNYSFEFSGIVTKLGATYCEVNMVEEARDPQIGASRKSSANELAGIRPAYMHEVGDFSEPRKRRRGQSSHQMCITPGCSRVAVRGGKPGLCITHGGGPVSYTHLTLPTICSV